MKSVIVLFLAALLMAGCVLPPAPNVPRTTHRIYDEHGRYKGRIDASGRIFNDAGKYGGQFDSHGRRYGMHSRYMGVIK